MLKRLLTWLFGAPEFAEPEISTPGPVPHEALAFFRAKRLQPSFDYRDVWNEEHAVNFTVAKMTQMDLLQSVQDSLTKALASGQTFEGWKKELMPQLADAGWVGRKVMTDEVTGEEKTVELGTPRRLATIYQTNMRSARAAGQWARIERTQDALPYLLWQLGPSKHHRDQHVAWAGTLLPVTDPFWNQHTPPCGYGCKCWLRQVSKPEHAELTAPGSKRGEKLGIKTSRPADWNKMVDYENTRSGEVTQVPVGITPGFAFNPGKVSRQVQLQQAFTQKMKGIDTPIVRAATQELVQSPAFDLFLKRPQGFFPMAVLSGELGELAQVKNAAVMLPAETLQDLRARSPQLSDEDFRALATITEAHIVQRTDTQLIASFRSGGDLFLATLEPDEDGTEYHVVNLARAHGP